MRQQGSGMQHAELTLPSDRAFVVQFRGTTEPATDVCAGRIEHLASGQAAHFDSWERLQQFIEHILTKIGDTQL